MARGPFIIFIAKCPRGDQVRGGGGGLLWHTGAAREAPGQGAVRPLSHCVFELPFAFAFWQILTLVTENG